jgi:TPR repeat protein
MLKGTLTIGFMWVLLCGSAIGQTSGSLPYSDDPMEQFRQAMERRSMKAAWSAVIIVQQGAGTKRDPKRADEMWSELWDKLAQPSAGLNPPPNAVSLLRAAANLGLPSAMRRLSEILEHGEFGFTPDPIAAAEWRKRAAEVASQQQ